MTSASGPDPSAERFHSPKAAPAGCSDCAPVNPAAATRLVYAVGSLEPRFPSLGVEKEFAQLSGTGGPAAATERRRVLDVMSSSENEYLGRAMCWVLAVQGVDAFSVSTRDWPVADLVEAAAPGRITFVSGYATPGGCLGTVEVRPVHLLTFALDDFVDQLAANIGEDSTDPTASARHGEDTQEGHQAHHQGQEAWLREVATDTLNRVMSRSENVGVTPEDRAVNYLALRYPAMYRLCADQYAQGSSLVALDARHHHAGSRATVAVRLVFRNPRTDLQSQYACRVDVEEVFPFLASPLQQTFDG